jgi:hypothetical protein
MSQKRFELGKIIATISYTFGANWVPTDLMALHSTACPWWFVVTICV